MRRFIVLLLPLLALAGFMPAAPVAHAQAAVDTAIDVGLIIDNSGSMNDNDPQEMRFSAAKLFINLLSAEDQVGIVSMGARDSTKTKLSLNPVTDASGLTRNAFKERDELSDYTYMGESLDLAAQLMENAASYNEQRAIILLTDGLPTYLDEDRAAQEQKFAAAVERFKREGIKIFPIALGGAADVQFLEAQLAAPTNGQVVKAESADQLLRVYIDILAQLQEGRYVDVYDVLGNVETFLANVNPRQQIKQINFVFPGQNGNVPEIAELRLPRSVRSRVNELSRITDPNWSLWTARPQYIRGVEGEWRVTLNSAQSQVPMIAVIQSDLRTKLDEPIASRPDDDAAVRYYPAGRPLLLRSAVRNKEDKLEKRIGISVQMRAPQQGENFALSDEGTEQDLAPVDGMYAGLIDQPLAPGTYRIVMNITPSESHLRLEKAYDIVVEPLPTMQATVEPDGPLAANEPARIRVQWQLDGQPVQLEGAEIRAAVKRDGKVIDQVQLVAAGDGTWEAEYVPAESGEYTFGLTAHAEWNAQDRGLRRYTDYVDVNFDAARRAEIEIAMSEPTSEPERVDTLSNGIQRTLTYRSRSDRPIELKLQVEGVPDARVYPPTLSIPPGEANSRTVTISTPAVLPSGEHTARLLVQSTGDVQLSATEMPISFRVNGWLARNRLLVMLLLLSLLLLTIKRVRVWLTDWITRNVELIRYGGR